MSILLKLTTLFLLNYLFIFVWFLINLIFSIGTIEISSLKETLTYFFITSLGYIVVIILTATLIVLLKYLTQWIKEFKILIYVLGLLVIVSNFIIVFDALEAEVILKSALVHGVWIGILIYMIITSLLVVVPYYIGKLIDEKIEFNI